jgi:hypothetical protein
MTVAAVCCCRKIKKGRFQDHNRPLTWVELRGFEPLTPSMRTRCATGLRYSPKNLSQRSKLCSLFAPARSRPQALTGFPGDGRPGQPG